MYVVIFKARIKELTAEYTEMAKNMRELAVSKYSCCDFISSLEDSYEIALSYWNNEKDILAWRKDSNHKLAQQEGKNRWYFSYSVEVAEIRRSYNFSFNKFADKGKSC